MRQITIFRSFGFVFITGQLAVGEFTTRCYNVNNYEHCFSTDGTQKTWQGARDACQNRNSTLLSVTGSEIQSVLRDFRSNVTAIYSNYDANGTWLNVTTGILDSFHWIDGTRGNATVLGQFNDTRRFAVIMLNPNDNITAIYRAYPWDDLSHYICQFIGSDIDCRSGFRKNSVCYMKNTSETVTWFAASNRCLSMGGSLATFNNLTTPGDDNSLTTWLNLSPAVKYWVGLVRQWYIIGSQAEPVTDVQHTNWDSGSPRGPDDMTRCVLLTNNLQWTDSFGCSDPQRFACQTITTVRTSTTTSTTTTTTTSTTTRPKLTTTSSSSSSVQRLPSVASNYSIAQTLTEQPLTSQPSLSSTASANNVNNADGETATTNTIPLAVGIGVGVGVPVLIVLIVVLIIILHRRRHKNRDEDNDAKITAVKKRVSRKWSKQKHINAYETTPNGEFENYLSPPQTHPHAEDPVYAAVVKNSNETEPEVHDTVIYAQLQQVS